MRGYRFSAGNVAPPSASSAARCINIGETDICNFRASTMTILIKFRNAARFSPGTWAAKISERSIRDSHHPLRIVTRSLPKSRERANRLLPDKPSPSPFFPFLRDNHFVIHTISTIILSRTVHKRPDCTTRIGTAPFRSGEGEKKSSDIKLFPLTFCAKLFPFETYEVYRRLLRRDWKEVLAALT